MFCFLDIAAGHLEFKLLVEPADGPSFSVVLLAPSRQEKAAWTSDISQVGVNLSCFGSQFKKVHNFHLNKLKCCLFFYNLKYSWTVVRTQIHKNA